MRSDRPALTMADLPAGKEVSMGWYRRATMRIGLALWCLLGASSVFAAVQVMSEAALMVDGKVTKGEKQQLGHLT